MCAYDLNSLNLPRLSGGGLRAFAAALDRPLTRAALLPSLLRQGGVDHLRALRLSEDPTFYPLFPPAERALGPLSATNVEAATGTLAGGETYPGHSLLRPFTTARDYAQAYRQSAVTPVEVAEKILAAIAESEAGEQPLHAFVANNRQDVLAQARASSERLRAGQPLSVLDGVPVAVKDEIDQAPYPTHVGTTFLAKNPDQDCTPVARLRAAGALLIGKANMNELGMDPCGFNAHYGTTRNPYNPAHDPGGSSSGPGAAIAAGLCPIAVGCDGGGSIRIPASLCGIVGLKPTFGRISEAGAPPLCPSVDVIGPLGASVEDVALAYGLMAGPDPRDPRSQYQPPVSLAGWKNPDLHGLTLGVYLPWFRHAAAEVVAACEAMLAQLEQAGAQVREIEVPGLDAMRVAHVVTILGEQAANMHDHREQIGQLGAPTRVTLALTHAFTVVDYVQAQRIRTRAIAAFEGIFESVDAILTPTTAITAPPIPPGGESGGWSDLSATTEKMRYAFPANLTGLPAISFPAGYDESGLPVGMQAMGRYWQEHLLLRIAFAAEQAVTRQAPQVFYPILG
jgi:Asp-tRNA(Asn)/Glu-tRNA(Gln) amidotransferase A subunit family amidase